MTMEKLARRMARKCRRIVEGVLYEWEAPEAEHEFYEAILEELQADVPCHEWSLEFCEGMEKWLRQGLKELHEALNQFFSEANDGCTLGTGRSGTGDEAGSGLPNERQDRSR